MQKIKENLESFFIIWGVVLLLNQVFLFHGCFNPVCLIAALPHTGFIAFLILIFFINDEKSNNTKSANIKNEYDESEIMSRYLEGYNRGHTRKNKPSQSGKEIDEEKIKTSENVLEQLEYLKNINLKIMKLKKLNKKLDVDDELKTLLEKLKDGDYAKHLKDIDNYLSKHNEVLNHADTEVQGLKKELKTLELKLQELVEQKTEYLNDIEEFNREYNLHLGEIIKDILNLKKEILYKQTINQKKEKEKYQEDIQTFQDTKKTIDELKSTISELENALDSIDEDDENYKELSEACNELKEELKKLEDELELQEEELELAKEFIEDETIEQEYEELNNHYEEFENEYEHIKESVQNSIILNDEEKKELKLLYKKAARICHPDIVPDELKEKAHELMQKLNDAYSKKEISKVKEILHSLQNGKSFELSSETIEDKELLKAKIKEYLKNIEAIKSEIEEIKEDETYQTIAELDDWDEYFEELRGGLEAEKERLEEEAREVLEEKEPLETTKAIKSQPPKKEKAKNITKENSPYAKHIHSIENIKFEKIRKYCENLSKENEADEMQKQLGENGKMYKALIYDALEQFISRLNGETITLCDWGCDQGIASMLVLDYIKEKQLDIKVSDVILIDDDTKALSRAMAQVEALAQDDIKFTPIKSDDNNISDKIKSNNKMLNLFANDKMPIDFLDIDYDIFQEAYFVCVSNSDREFVDDIYENFSDFIDIQNLSNRNGQIGRFQRFERIFTL